MTPSLSVFGAAPSGTYLLPRELGLTSGVKDLLAKLLRIDPAQRISMADIAAHPWLNKDLPPLDLSFNDYYLHLDTIPPMIARRDRVQREARALLAQVFALTHEAEALAHAPDSLDNMPVWNDHQCNHLEM